MINLPESIKRFSREDSGQSLVFAAMTFFAMLIIGVLVMGLGKSTSLQMEQQNAADAAAFAGAEVEANCVGQIAWINEAMAHVYYKTMRYAVDNTMAGVLAEMKGHKLYYGNSSLFSDYAQPSDELVMGVSGSSPIDLYNTAYTKAAEYLPLGHEWLKRLSRLQRGMAIAAPILMEQQVHLTAIRNGAEMACMYPKVRFIGNGPRKAWCDITREEKPNWGIALARPDGYSFSMSPAIGWLLEGTGLNGIFTFKVAHQPVSMSSPPVLDTFCDKLTNGSDGDWWHIERKIKDEDTAYVNVQSYYWYEGSTGTTLYPKYDTTAHPRITSSTAYAKHCITMQTGEATPELYIVFDYGDSVMVIHGDAETQIITHTDPLPEYYEVIQNGSSTFMRNGSDGLEYASDNNPTDSKITPPGETWNAASNESGSSVTADGVKLPVDRYYDRSEAIKLDDGLSIKIGPPLTIYLTNLEMRLAQPMNFDINTTVSPFNHVRLTDWNCIINSLTSPHDADSKWRRWCYSSDYWRNTDKIRHRMITEEPETCPSYVGPWRYEWVDTGALMENMDMDHFGRHAIMDMATDAGIYGQYASSPTSSDTTEWTNTGSNANWELFPSWARPQRTPTDASDTNYGGWFDPATGAPYSKYAYSQTRTCWYPKDAGEGTLIDYDWHSPTYMRECQRPCGFWQYSFSGNSHALAAVKWLIDNGYYDSNENSIYAGAVTVVPQTIHKRGDMTIVQITCPCCYRKNTYSHLTYGPPYTPGSTGLTGDSATTTAWADYLCARPSVVRKYIAQALGRHDSEKYGLDFQNRQLIYGTANTKAKTVTYDADFFAMVPSSNDNSSPWTWERPLALTSEIFRAGVTVATWKQPLESGLWDSIGGSNPTSQQRSVGINNPLKTQSWGHFGIATARVVFWNDQPGQDAEKAVDFPFGDNPKVDSSDVLGRPLSQYRNDWLDSQANHFEPDWNAALVSNRKAINTYDIYTSDEINDGTADDSATSYLFRQIQGADWEDSEHNIYRASAATGYKDWSSMDPPPMQSGGSNVDFFSKTIEDAVRH